MGADEVRQASPRQASSEDYTSCISAYVLHQMVNMGMDAKVLQYIMGHSAEIDATMNIYTHMGYERASYQMLKLVDGAGKEDNRIISMAQTDAIWSKTTWRFFYTPTTHVLHKNADNL